MRRFMCVLGIAALLGVALFATVGCGSDKAEASSSSASPRQLFTLDGFELRPGHPYRVSFDVDAPSLRIHAYVRGGGSGPAADPSLDCQLEILSGSRLVSVPLKAHARADGRNWLYAARTTGTLKAGSYRLTLTGNGSLHPFSVWQP